MGVALRDGCMWLLTTTRCESCGQLIVETDDALIGNSAMEVKMQTKTKTENNISKYRRYESCSTLFENIQKQR